MHKCVVSLGTQLCFRYFHIANNTQLYFHISINTQLYFHISNITQLYFRYFYISNNTVKHKKTPAVCFNLIQNGSIVIEHK